MSEMFSFACVCFVFCAMTLSPFHVLAYKRTAVRTNSRATAMHSATSVAMMYVILFA
jgi:hypothetical protein